MIEANFEKGKLKLIESILRQKEIWLVKKE